MNLMGTKKKKNLKYFKKGSEKHVFFILVFWFLMDEQPFFIVFIVPILFIECKGVSISEKTINFIELKYHRKKQQQNPSEAAAAVAYAIATDGMNKLNGSDR